MEEPLQEPCTRLPDVISVTLSIQNTCICVGSQESLFRKPRKWNVSRRNTSTLTKADRKLMIRSTIRTSRLTESGNRAKTFSWSAIHGIFQIRESARFIAEIHNPRAFYGQIRRSADLFTPLLKLQKSRQYDILAKTRSRPDDGYHVFPPKRRWFVRAHYLILRTSRSRRPPRLRT